MKVSYNHQKVERYWREYWQKNNIEHTNLDSDKKKYYCLDMFPYPSGAGLHVGHWRGYVLSDIIARMKRLQGHEVLHPMGFDAFGLPAENSAIKTGVHPAESTAKSINYLTKQLKEISALYDWKKSLDTSSPDYYHWTQWLFLQLFKKGLAYKKVASVNWCPSCQTVLANEQVVNGTCERCDSMVEKKEMSQWYFKITDYADQLLDGLADLDWSDTVKTLQHNWIGKSHGSTINFAIEGHKQNIEVFTTRLDTVFGCTYIALAPESPLLDKLVVDGEQKKQLAEFRKQVQKMSTIERQENVQKLGFNTGVFAINPFNNEQIAIYAADYVLGDYGTGAVMCVPAHDQRDFEFAQKYNIKIKTVISPTKEATHFAVAGEAYIEQGFLINSEQYSGLASIDAIGQLQSDSPSVKATVNYRMRDWLVSRQRYWGCPIPIVHCEACGLVPLPEDDLPLQLPQIKDFKPKGVSPLASVTQFVNTTCPKCKKPAKRETDTLDTFVDSSWYYLRYLDPKNTKNAFDTKHANKWLPVDLYIGGVEHATKHLLYARFITKFLADEGYVNFREPFTKLFGIGLIYLRGAKMSKSRGNVASPDEIVKYYGTDALRGYEMFIGPNDQFAEWTTSGINGIYRFIVRLYSYTSKLTPASDDNPKLERELNQFIAEYTNYLLEFKTNLALAQAMTLFKKIEKQALSASQMKRFVILLSPFFPFLGEELHRILGGEGSIFDQSWPTGAVDAPKTQTIPLLVNNRVKTTIEAPLNLDSVALTELAKSELEKLDIEQSKIVKIFAIPGKTVNVLIDKS